MIRHLWWLLVVKERLKWAAFDSIAEKLEVGETYYYFADTKAKKERRSMLKSLGVQLVPIVLVKNDWKKFYKEAFDKIKTKKHA